MAIHLVASRDRNQEREPKERNDQTSQSNHPSSTSSKRLCLTDITIETILDHSMRHVHTAARSQCHARWTPIILNHTIIKSFFNSPHHNNSTTCNPQTIQQQHFVNLNQLYGSNARVGRLSGGLNSAHSFGKFDSTRGTGCGSMDIHYPFCPWILAISTIQDLACLGSISTWILLLQTKLPGMIGWIVTAKRHNKIINAH